MGILELCITVFVTQLIFIGCRTWNVMAISKENIKDVVISGALVHISWLVSIAIGATSMYELISNWNIDYIPVILCSLVGGIIGSVIALKYKSWKKEI